jgi:hypothetical protein
MYATTVDAARRVPVRPMALVAGSKTEQRD